MDDVLNFDYIEISENIDNRTEALRYLLADAMPLGEFLRLLDEMEALNRKSVKVFRIFVTKNKRNKKKGARKTKVQKKSRTYLIRSKDLNDPYIFRE